MFAASIDSNMPHHLMRWSTQVVNEDGSLSKSTVYLFPHFETAGNRQFLEITTATGQQVRFIDSAGRTASSGNIETLC